MERIIVQKTWAQDEIPQHPPPALAVLDDAKLHREPSRADPRAEALAVRIWCSSYAIQGDQGENGTGEEDEGILVQKF